MTHRTVRNCEIVNPAPAVLHDLGWLLLALAILLAASGLVAGWSIAMVMGTYLVPGLTSVKLVKLSHKGVK
jgi:hypothetical protein